MSKRATVAPRTLLADRVLNWPLIVPGVDQATRNEVTQRLRHVLEGARIVTAQAVYERVRGSNVDFREIAPLPPVSSPIWVEYETSGGSQYGAVGLFEGDETEGMWALQALIGSRSLREAMWLGEEMQIPTSAGFGVREGARHLAQPWLSDMIASDPARYGGTLHFGVAMFAVALLASHNIETRWVDPPAVKSRSRRPRHNRPLVRYEEIVVRPAPAEQDRSVPRASGIVQAGHTVRGHFAHYGRCCGSAHEEKGKLFGRYERRIWIDEHEAGKPDLGYVVSDLRLS
jgi:hypothetical protein